MLSTGELIRDTRRRKGLTQQELAERVGTKFQSISQWELGKRKPKYDTLQKIASALDVPIDDLFPARNEETGLWRFFFLSFECCECHAEFDVFFEFDYKNGSLFCPRCGRRLFKEDKSNDRYDA